MTTSATIDTSNLAFSGLFTTTRGAKQLHALYTNGEAVIIQLDELHAIPFEQNAFNDPDANRVNLFSSMVRNICEMELLHFTP